MDIEDLEIGEFYWYSPPPLRVVISGERLPAPRRCVVVPTRMATLPGVIFCTWLDHDSKQWKAVDGTALFRPFRFVRKLGPKEREKYALSLVRAKLAHAAGVKA